MRKHRGALHWPAMAAAFIGCAQSSNDRAHEGRPAADTAATVATPLASPAARPATKMPGPTIEAHAMTVHTRMGIVGLRPPCSFMPTFPIYRTLSQDRWPLHQRPRRADAPTRSKAKCPLFADDPLETVPAAA